MQLLRLAAVLTVALPAVVSAAQCNQKSASEPTAAMEADALKIDEAIQKVTREALESLRKRQTADDVANMTIECKPEEKCYMFDVPACYDEKTTTARSAEGIAITLKTGDIIFPDNTKVNVFTGQEALKEALKKGIASLQQDFGKEASTILEGLTNIAFSPVSATAAPSTMATVKSPAAAPAAATGASQSGTAAPTAAKSSASQQPENSAAGKMVVGGWVAAVAALAAVVVA